MCEIQGIVDNIIFKNNDNGYVVANLKNDKNKVTIVGCIPYIIEGQNLKLEGKWVVHPQFGEQFKVEICEEILPNSTLGIEKYLSSGVISGIGPVTAKKIVEKFAEDTLDILDNDINKLKEVEGIGDKKLDKIKESYNKQREIRNIMVFLQTYGVTPKQCVKIYKKYGKDSITKVRENPYILTEDISGIGFKTSDKIARSLGIDKNSPFRIQSGIKYVINEFCAVGNTYMPLDKLIRDAEKILLVAQEEIEKNIYDTAIDGKIKIEEIDGAKCVFSIPFYYSELNVTRKALTLSLAKHDEMNIDVEKKIKMFQDKNNIEFSPSQKEAIETAFSEGMEVITGGPGTGKTTIINCITEIFENHGMSVFMAAPTGRAAKRMEEASGHEAKTIHRLLEMGFNNENSDLDFIKNEEEPLECDVLIIDEASMIDILLMNNLLKAMSIGTRLILVGDVDQLPSVGPGNVLRDIIESNCIKVVRLKEIFRQGKESMIIVNAHKINEGKMPFLNKRDKDFYFLKEDDENKILDTVVDLISERLPKFNKKWNKIEDIQILSPMRRGRLGVENLNEKLQQILNPKQSYKKEKIFRNSVFRVGDKVMQMKNNYSLKWSRIDEFGEEEKGIGVFNGDLGVIEDIDEEDETIKIVFDDNRVVIYDSIYLDEISLAYAMTIHKSQGSEFPVVIMPMFMGPPLLMNRNLLYTGITRAKKLVVLVGNVKSLYFMVNNNRTFERYSSLKWRMCNILEG